MRFIDAGGLEVMTVSLMELLNVAYSFNVCACTG